ncbi:MAG TPA: iron-sulfur cluster repair di-iron protein [Candidatus Deferrimicrobium sp.]|nr:iron-sulfur cluster repair di-iron protein [Candidatus Deferrimicrobium sp.]
MDQKFNSQSKIGDIVAAFPGASEIFKAYKVDFCCGGNRPLIEAIKEQQLNEGELLDKLNQGLQKIQEEKGEDIDWRNEPLGKLVDHIINNHHTYVQRELPQISELTTKILRVHGANHGELAKVHRLFHTLKMELEQHLIKEEEVLFPLIKQYEQNPSKETLDRISKQVLETEQEHDAAGDIIKELREITAQYTVPQDACTTYGLTYRKLVDFEADLFQHIHLENNILFKRLGIEANKSS